MLPTAFVPPYPFTLSKPPSPFLNLPPRMSTPSKPRTTRARPRPSPAEDPRQDRWAPENLGFIHIGSIIGPHGVRGEAKVLCEGEFATERLGTGVHGPKGAKLPLQRFLLLPGRRYPRPVDIGVGRRASQKGTWILRVGELTNRDQVLELRGARIYVKEGDRPKLKRGEFMVGDLVGSRVRLEGGIVGVVETVITRDDLCRASGAGDKAAAVASDLLEVAIFEIGEKEGEEKGWDAEIPEDAKRVLVPFVAEIVPFVDIEKREIILDPPLGLFDIAVVNRKEKRRTPRGLLMPAKD